VIDLLLRAIDRVIELVKIRERRHESRFKEIHQPTFEDLKVVHSDYLMMYTELDQLLRFGRRCPAETDSVLTSAIDFLAKKRIVFEPVRAKLQAFLDTLYDDQSLQQLSETEVAFVLSIRNYLLANQQPLWGECYGLPSSSTSLLNVMYRAQLKDDWHYDIELLCEQLALICNRLRDEWKAVSVCYLKLRLDLASRITT
jgi:hypothetical protein